MWLIKLQCTSTIRKAPHPPERFFGAQDRLILLRLFGGVKRGNQIHNSACPKQPVEVNEATELSFHSMIMLCRSNHLGRIALKFQHVITSQCTCSSPKKLMPDEQVGSQTLVLLF